MLGKVTLLIAVLIAFGNAEIGKRRASCPKKYQSLEGHSACVPPSPDAEDTGVSAEEAKLIIEEHLRVRREVDPPAADMREITWDDDLATTAQAWAEACTLEHDKNENRLSPGRFGVGQNLAQNYPSKDWKIAIEGWESEKKDFQYGGPQRGVVGHYTQMVWASTSTVGCGFAKCGKWNYYVCNYGPAGNNFKTKNTPWKSGKPCGECPGKCKDKICDCGGKTCLNDAATDLKTCDCKCLDSMAGGPLPFYKAPTCKLECAGIEEPGYCGTQFTKASCAQFANVKAHCPKMCGICP